MVGKNSLQGVLFRLLVGVLFTALALPLVPLGQGAVAGWDAAASEATLSDYLSEKWKVSVWGQAIGDADMTIVDLDGDGWQEVVVDALHNSVGYDRYWYIFSYQPATGIYEQEWVSKHYANMSRIVVADGAPPAGYEIYVALGTGDIEVYNGTTRELVHTMSSGIAYPTIAVADVEDDGVQEIVACSPSACSVFDASTYQQEWSTPYAGNDVAVANVDADPAPEIVTTQYVIDGVTHNVEWDYTSGFGNVVRLADIDGDIMAEIVGGHWMSNIRAFDVDLQSVKWQLDVSMDQHALRVGDIDGDTVQEILYGEDQWGAVHCVDSVTLVEEWAINNPRHGVTDLGYADMDGDGQTEILWGSGWTDSGPDYVYVADVTTQVIEWQSVDLVGPLSSQSVDDVDGDGTQELVLVSFLSDSRYDDGIILVYNAETYELEWQSPPIMGGNGLGGARALQVGDVDDDGQIEIVVSTFYGGDGVIVAYDGTTHEVKWQAGPYGGVYFSALAIADVDNDGVTEVVGGESMANTSAPGIYTCVLNGHGGQVEWCTAELDDYATVYDIAVADTDADGHPEIIFSVYSDLVHVYDGVDRVQDWQSSLIEAGAVAVADVDQDGTLEILTGTNTGHLYAYDGQTYAQEWSQSISSQEIRSLDLDDLDQNGAQEFIITDDETLSVRDAATRALLWQSPLLGTRVGYGGHLASGDIDRDGRAEVVVGYSYALSVFTYDLLPYGSAKQVDRALARTGDRLEYTIGLNNYEATTLTASMVDSVPTDTTYISGTLWVSGGNWEVAGDTISWTVDIAPSSQVTLTFAVSVGLGIPDGSWLENTAIYCASAITTSRTARTLIDAAPPETIIVRPVGGELVSGTTYIVQGTAVDQTSGVDHVEVNIGGTGWQEAIGTDSWSYTWTLPLTDSDVTIQARAVDSLGQRESPGPSVVVRVDTLSPFISSTNPVHGQAQVPLDQSVTVCFSEPVLSATLDFACQPDPGGWAVEQSPDGMTVVLNHAPFNPSQLHTCQVRHVQDLAGNDLVSGPVPNPWDFVTLVPCDPVAGIAVAGPSQVDLGETALYSATYQPLTATLPVTLTWDNGAMGPTAAYSWTVPGAYTLTVTATNPCGHVSETLTVQVLCRPVEAVMVSGPAALAIGEQGLYTVTYVPLTATLPITLSWSNGVTGPTAAYSWTLPGSYSVTITVTNACSQLAHELQVEVKPVQYWVYLPLIIKGR